MNIKIKTVILYSNNIWVGMHHGMTFKNKQKNYGSTLFYSQVKSPSFI